MKKIIYIILFLSISTWGFAADQNIYLDNLGAGAGTIGDPYGAFSEINWTTIANWVTAGDTVYINLKRDSVWRETLVMGADGASGRPITIKEYGSGTNPPTIKLTNLVTGWTKDFDGDTNGVYRASVPANYVYGVLNEAGDGRMNRYNSLPAWGSFEAGYNYGYYSSSYVYVKAASGSSYPDPDDWNSSTGAEVGARNFGILIVSHNYITIDGIRILGPSGGPDAYDLDSDENTTEWVSGSKYTGGVVAKWQSYVTVKNCTIRYHSGSAVIWRSAGSNGIAQNNWMDDSWTGAWVESSGQTWLISGNLMTRISVREGDTGDRNAVGAFTGVSGSCHTANDIIVEDNYIYDIGTRGGADPSGRPIELADVNGYIVRRNYVKDSGCGGINVGTSYMGGSYGAQVYNNVVDNYNLDPGWEEFDERPFEAYDGIIIASGGGNYEPINTLIYNNLIINGHNDEVTGGFSFAAMKIKASTSKVDGTVIWENLHVKNNIFHNNNLDYELIFPVQSGNISGERKLDRNYFYKTSGNIANIIGTIFDTSNIASMEVGRDYVNNNSNKNTCTYAVPVLSNGPADDPLLNQTTMSYTTSSPACIQNGGEVIANVEAFDEFTSAISSARVWTPLALADQAIVTRGTTYSMGPFEISDAIIETFISNRSPAHMATDIALDSAMSWTNPEGATAIDIRYSCSSDDPPVVSADQDPAAITSYDPAGLMASYTRCWWGVDVDDALGEIWYFDTIESPPDPVATGKIYIGTGGTLSCSSGSLSVLGSSVCSNLQTPSETAEAVGQFEVGKYNTRTRLGTKFVYTGTTATSICAINLYTKFTGSSVHYYHAEIYSHDSGNNAPDASLGASDATDLSGIGTSEISTPFYFTNPTSALANGTTYWVVLSSVGDAYNSSSYASWYYNESGTTERVIEYNNSTSAWGTSYDTATFKYELYSR